MTSIFIAYRDSPQRRTALGAPVGSAERYLLFGLDQLRARGMAVTHNLEKPGPPPAWARHGGGAVKVLLERAGGYGGDFATVFASLRDTNRAGVVLSTVDTVGIPLMLAKRGGRLRPPLVYVAVGLPERLARLRGRRMESLYASSLTEASTVVTYSEYEAEALLEWTAAHGRKARVEFVPFGVDTKLLVPSAEPKVDDVVSVGADPHRDFELLLRVAEAQPGISFRIVAAADRAKSLVHVPPNVTVELDLPFSEMLVRLRGARAVALPVRDNSYSGATTVLLQAMALAKPVVVTGTKAITRGYGLVDGENCRLVPPGDAVAFELALTEVLRDERGARALGARARLTAEAELTWAQYVERLATILHSAADADLRERAASA